jgi:hypothetical protein
MGGLTASALPVASPAAAGLLSLAFLFSFPGGFELRWGNTATGQEALTPSITFFGDLAGTESVTRGLAPVPARQLESGLVVVTLNVNGVAVPALLDTGSPVTVLNAAAAKLVGLAVSPSAAAAAAAASAKSAEDAATATRSRNPLARFVASVQANVQATQAAQAAQAAQAVQAAAQSTASSGEVLVLGGPGGARIELRRLAAAQSVAIGGVELGGDDLRCYVGDLPGLAALGGLGAAAGPAAVLGTDILRRRPRLVLQDGKVYL